MVDIMPQSVYDDLWWLLEGYSVVTESILLFVLLGYMRRRKPAHFDSLHQVLVCLFACLFLMCIHVMQRSLDICQVLSWLWTPGEEIRIWLGYAMILPLLLPGRQWLDASHNNATFISLTLNSLGWRSRTWKPQIWLQCKILWFLPWQSRAGFV